MAVLLQVGIAYPNELAAHIGHVACTLGGVNYESRGSRGCLRGSAARGATSPLFRHRFFIAVSRDAALEAKKYADSCVGQNYVWDRVPTAHHGGDCSGYVSGIVCAAKGEPVRRLFWTGNWADVYARLGFHKGLGGGAVPAAAPAGVADRPYPGYPIREGSQHPGHVRWIQARLDFAAHDSALAVDGAFGPRTHRAVVAFQLAHRLVGDGIVGPRTWAALNAVR